MELVCLLTPLTSEQYENWRNEFLATHAAPAAGTKKKRKKVKGAAENDEPVVPPGLFEALHADTGKLQAAAGISRPARRS